MRVLLATDGSDEARAAATWMAQFPVPAGSRLRVVSAVTIPPSPLDIPTVREFTTALREAAHQAAEGARRLVAPRFTDSDALVLEGDAREAILRAAEEWPADLIVLGARGLGALAGFLLGGVSLNVARQARCSVLVVKHGADLTRGILIGIDGSDHAAAAPAFVARLPLDPATVVRLVGVVQPPAVPGTTPRFAQGIVRDAIAQIVKDHTVSLERAMVKAAAPFEGVVKKVEHQVLVGHVVDTMLSTAVKNEVGLVVVGARGLGTLQRLLLGSVSESVLCHADRPVLIVRPSV
jgi:nucleotide-binding universal stress UspA family protein